MKLRQRAVVCAQFGRPTGFWGRAAGLLMAHRASNRRRNAWAVSLLELRPEDRVLRIGFGPGLAIRGLGRLARKGYVCGRFFDSVAVGWDERVRSDSPEYLEPLLAALDHSEASPGRILYIGTGTGAALELADRYPDA